MVTHGQQVLFGKRCTKSTAYEWQLPGGWIEPGESPLQAAKREVREETGLTIESPRFVAITSNRFSPQNHSITLYFEAACRDTGGLHSPEPEKNLEWQWRAWSKVGDRLYLPLRLLKNSNYRPFLADNGRTYVSI